MALTYIRREDLGLQFEWNGAHTVNVQSLDDPTRDLDCFSIGSFAQNHASYEEFVSFVESYGRSEIETIDTDADGFVYVRTTDGELCGPYDSEAEALADFE